LLRSQGGTAGPARRHVRRTRWAARRQIRKFLKCQRTIIPQGGMSLPGTVVDWWVCECVCSRLNSMIGRSVSRFRGGRPGGPSASVGLKAPGRALRRAFSQGLPVEILRQFSMVPTQGSISHLRDAGAGSGQRQQLLASICLEDGCNPTAESVDASPKVISRTGPSERGAHAVRWISPHSHAPSAWREVRTRGGMPDGHAPSWKTAQPRTA